MALKGFHILSLETEEDIYRPICRDLSHANTRRWPAPMAPWYRLGIVTWWYQARVPVGPDICHLGCAYTVLQTVQRPGVYSAAYGTVHYKKPLKSFEIIIVEHSLGFARAT